MACSKFYVGTFEKANDMVETSPLCTHLESAAIAVSSFHLSYWCEWCNVEQILTANLQSIHFMDPCILLTNRRASTYGFKIFKVIFQKQKASFVKKKNVVKIVNDFQSIVSYVPMASLLFSNK